MEAVNTGAWCAQQFPASSEGKAVAMTCRMFLYIIWITITLRHTDHKSRAQKNEDDPCVSKEQGGGAG